MIRDRLLFVCDFGGNLRICELKDIIDLKQNERLRIRSILSNFPLENQFHGGIVIPSLQVVDELQFGLAAQFWKHELTFVYTIDFVSFSQPLNPPDLPLTGTPSLTIPNIFTQSLNPPGLPQMGTPSFTLPIPLPFGIP